MSFMNAVAQTGGEDGLAAVAAATGLDSNSARSAMDALCPAIARQLQAKAKDDPGLLDHLLDLLDDNSAGDGPAGEEAMLDGGAMLEALYGSEAAALSALKTIVPEAAQPALDILAPVSAAAVIAAVAQQHPAHQAQASALSQALPAVGGSIVGSIIGALVAGAIRGVVRQITSQATRSITGSITGRQRRSGRTAGTGTGKKAGSGTGRRRRKAAADTSTSSGTGGTTGINLEDILGGIFGTKRN